MQQNHTLNQIQESLLAQNSSLLSIVQTYLSNIKKTKKLNIYTQIYESEALTKAKEIDQKIANGQSTQLGKLFGAIISIKDMIAYKDKPLTAASLILKNYTTPISATVVSRCLNEDAIIIGTTNCDEFGMGSTNTNSSYGPTHNPINPEYITGGSSGGAAASVKANTCLAALGTDTGGSIRQPAAFTSTLGFKPTYGTTSRHGIIAYASSFDQVGIISKDHKTTQSIFSVISGPDQNDMTLHQKKTQPVSTAPKKIKCAFLPQIIQNPKLDPEIKESIQHTLQTLKKNQQNIQEVTFPFLDYLVPTYYILTTAEASSNLARYDGIRYGQRDTQRDTSLQMIKNTRTKFFGKEAKKRILTGTYILSSGYYDTYYTKAQKTRNLIYQSTLNILQNVDCIILPTSPSLPWKISQNNPDPNHNYLTDIYTVWASLCGLPAISIPVSNSKKGLPIGIQIIGPPFSDHKLLHIAHKIQQFIKN